MGFDRSDSLVREIDRNQSRFVAWKSSMMHMDQLPVFVITMVQTVQRCSTSPHDFQDITIREKMATIRRLSDEDVRSIFESVHHGRPSPAHLQFQIVPVGPEGLRLSPPSYQFQDGLYILMKPQKKKADPSEQPKVPPHLINHVIHDIPSSSCPWSLSGPQFPQPTAIQQRYCYPKGDPEYSSQKGGALWTMYGADGKENLEYRLLHVYFSAKRAVNKGMTASTPKRAKKSPRRSLLAKLPVSPFDNMKRQTAPPSLPSPTISPVPSPPISPMLFRSNFVSPFDDSTFHPMPDSPFRPRILAAESWDDEHSHQHSINLDPFHFEMGTTSMQELEDSCWNDPLFSACENNNEDRLLSLASGLNKMHSFIREKILAAPESEQALLTSALASWARQVAQDPLCDPNCEQV